MDIDPMKAGFGVRHPAVANLVATNTPAASEQLVWPGGLRLSITGYLGTQFSVPDELIVSVRCITRVGSGVIVVKGPSEEHIWPGGRREPGETYVETACREVHEETGWILDSASIHQLGLLHLEMLDPQPDDHPSPHPDFLQVVLVGSAAERDGGPDIDWQDTDGWELGSRVIALDEIDAIPLSHLQLAFITALADAP